MVGKPDNETIADPREEVWGTARGGNGVLSAAPLTWNRGWPWVFALLAGQWLRETQLPKLL